MSRAASLPAVGAPAPDFTLPSTSGIDVTLSRLRGRNVLLAFFPKTEGLPISVDSVPTLREFKAKERLTVDLLSDFKREGRAYVLIGPDGLVRWTYAEETPGTRRGSQELLAQVLETHQRTV